MRAVEAVSMEDTRHVIRGQGSADLKSGLSALLAAHIIKRSLSVCHQNIFALTIVVIFKPSLLNIVLLTTN